MDELIQQAFAHVDVVGPRVRAGRFDLVGSDGEFMLKQMWSTVIRPGCTVTMHMWPLPEDTTQTEASYGDPTSHLTPLYGDRAQNQNTDSVEPLGHFKNSIETTRGWGAAHSAAETGPFHEGVQRGPTRAWRDEFPSVTGPYREQRLWKDTLDFTSTHEVTLRSSSLENVRQSYVAEVEDIEQAKIDRTEHQNRDASSRDFDDLTNSEVDSATTHSNRRQGKSLEAARQSEMAELQARQRAENDRKEYQKKFEAE